MIIDADTNVSTRRSQLQSKLNEFGSKARIFLIPNDKNSGCLEDLLEHLVPRAYQPIIKCWDNFIEALRELKRASEVPLVPPYNIPSPKTKFYSYASLLLEKREEGKDVAKEESRRYKDVKHWDLNAPYLDPLKKFIDGLI